jgi:hypothetical protein
VMLPDLVRVCGGEEADEYTDMERGLLMPRPLLSFPKRFEPEVLCCNDCLLLMVLKPARGGCGSNSSSTDGKISRRKGSLPLPVSADFVDLRSTDAAGDDNIDIACEDPRVDGVDGGDGSRLLIILSCLDAVESLPQGTALNLLTRLVSPNASSALSSCSTNPRTISSTLSVILCCLM